jgi:photosystem II stability/assembly factor-like uncharacterized protein
VFSLFGWLNTTSIVIEADGTTWTIEQTNLVGTENIENLYFYNQNVIYGSTYKYYVLDLYRTLDSGKSWEKLSAIKDIYLKDIFFISPDEGFLLGAKLKPSSSPMDNGAIIMKTSDGGKNWETVFSTVGVELNKIVFNSQGTGVVVGRKDIKAYTATHFVLLTKDKGQSWTDISEKLNRLELSPQGDVADFSTNALFSKNRGIVLLSLRGKIFNTTDEGKSWNFISKILKEPAQTGISNFGEFEDGRFWLSGGTISIEGRWGMLSVMNGRRGWNTYRLWEYPFADIKFLSDDEVLACGTLVGEKKFGGANELNKGVILFSKDSGKTWIKVYQSATAHNFGQIIQLSRNKFLINGDNKEQVILERTGQ